MENSTSELSGLNRLDLYKRVWVTPVTKLAVEFGVKPQLLTKLCDGLHVPRPSSGYWTQIRMGRLMEMATILKPGETFKSRTEFSFGIVEPTKDAK